jgi:hypothetical protein
MSERHEKRTSHLTSTFELSTGGCHAGPWALFLCACVVVFSMGHCIFKVDLQCFQT